ncbi:hypothetical protein BaRGS_00001359 [Batillaria attramentaria]|uniref:Sperm protamine P1 n=1 Tax=Batillaria attramentaria TaxID=370345 RepID=A0ABD0M639_9CAEN
MSKLTKRGRRKSHKRKVGRPKRKGAALKSVRGMDTTGRAVTTALRRYPTRAGATIQQIHRLLVKKDRARKLRRTRTVASVKLALARAVKRGSIKPPKGWNGFRGLGVRPAWVPGSLKAKAANRSRRHSRRGSIRRKSSTRRPSIRRKSSVRRHSSRRPSTRRGHSARKRGLKARSRSVGMKLRPRSKSVKQRGRSLSKRGVRGRSASKRGPKPRSRTVSKRGMRARSKRAASRGRPRGSTKNENSTGANNSSNYNGEQGEEEGEMAPIWKAYPCIIS